jgi:hypothetical protein
LGNGVIEIDPTTQLPNNPITQQPNYPTTQLPNNRITNEYAQFVAGRFRLAANYYQFFDGDALQINTHLQKSTDTSHPEFWD